MTVVTKAEREEYTVTVNAPTAFLANPTTVYPVTVDPTVTITESEIIGETSDGAIHGSGIDDLCIYNGSNPGYPESSIGVLYYNEDSCETETARMLYRINPNYYEYQSIANYLSSSRFSEATLYLQVNSYGNSIAVNIYPYTDEWGVLFDENDEKYYTNGTVADYTGTVDYNSYDANVCVYSTVETSSYTTVGFDITDIVEYWGNNNNCDRGLVLGCEDDFSTEHEVTEPVYLDIRQTEHTSSYVYISVDYGTVVGENYINNKQTGHFLSNNGSDNQTSTSTYTSDVDVADENLNKKWNITYYGNNQYCITCVENSNLILYAVGGTIAKVAVRPATLTNEYLWTITYNLAYDGYLIRNVAYNRYLKATDSDTTVLSSTLNSYCVWRLKNPSKYRPLLFYTVDDIVMNVGETVTPMITVYPGNSTWATLSDFTWSSANTAVVSTSNSGSINIVTYNADGIIITANHKESGNTYTFKVCSFLPLSGYELDYSPLDWDSYAGGSCNCYSYAINNQTYPGTNYLYFKQPMGEYSSGEYSSLTEVAIYEAVCNDYEKFNSEYNTSLSFQRIGRYDICPAGTYKIALVIDPNNGTEENTVDYHWYRQDSDGYWSHKQGITPVKRTDSSENLIVDPQTANCGTYTVFCGYYAVSPWNNMWTESDLALCYWNDEIYEYYQLIEILIELGLLSQGDTESELCYK